jgi:4-diphosphocytidyl-2-C-methyl-D-erythritol kinase
MNTVTLRANAKINLMLDIVGRRPDGYHDLIMVMQSVSLYDLLTAERTDEPGVWLECDHPGMPADNSLVHKAARAFFAHTGISGGVKFKLQCRIPMQAGLGGGSADAAAALTALNLLYDAGLDEDTLCALGLKLGADVPFCVVGGTRLAKGVGERLQPLPAPPECGIVLVKPAVGASTAAQFARADAVPDLPHPSADAMTGALQHGDLTAVCAALGNSFESVIGLDEIPQCRQVLLEAGAIGARMTGSGSTVFGIFPSEEAAQAAAPLIQAALPDCGVFPCRPAAQGIELHR